ncbi:MAG: GNAT family N-acetyltransferase [Defluviitaleaceae bacterium]|nr:GNAT family N-acetyltransferase [Defluviitaleaceae bacterium]
MEILKAASEDVKKISKELVSYNQSQVPFSEYQDLNYCVKVDDEIIAGIVADVYRWKVVEVSILWVKDEHRGKGLAKALLKKVENEAREIGCHLSHLDTFDFQARDFYEKQGYRVFGELEDCPKGHSRFYMSKKL